MTSPIAKPLTKNQSRIIRVVCANGGDYLSLFRLATELDIHYETAWLNVLYLSWMGYLRTERVPHLAGHPYKISVACGPVWPDITSTPMRLIYQPADQNLPTGCINPAENRVLDRESL